MAKRLKRNSKVVQHVYDLLLRAEEEQLTVDFEGLERAQEEDFLASLRKKIAQSVKEVALSTEPVENFNVPGPDFYLPPGVPDVAIRDRPISPRRRDLGIGCGPGERLALEGLDAGNWADRFCIGGKVASDSETMAVSPLKNGPTRGHASRKTASSPRGGPSS